MKSFYGTRHVVSIENSPACARTHVSRFQQRFVSVSAGVLMNEYITHKGKYDSIHNLCKHSRNPKSHERYDRQHWDQHRYPTNERQAS